MHPCRVERDGSGKTTAEKLKMVEFALRMSDFRKTEGKGNADHRKCEKMTNKETGG